MSQRCDCSGVSNDKRGLHMYSARCPIDDCDYKSKWRDTEDQIVYDLTVHLWSSHDEEVLAAYIANMMKEDPYDSYTDSRPYYLIKHVYD